MSDHDPAASERPHKIDEGRYFAVAVLCSIIAGALIGLLNDAAAIAKFSPRIPYLVGSIYGGSVVAFRVLIIRQLQHGRCRWFEQR